MVSRGGSSRLRKAREAEDLLRTMTERNADSGLQAEVTVSVAAKAGAEARERTAEQTTNRNGFRDGLRDRLRDARLGTLALKVLKWGAWAMPRASSNTASTREGDSRGGRAGGGTRKGLAGKVKFGR